MDAEEIKYRQLSASFLIKKGTLRDVTRSLCGIQAQFFSHALHALRIRCHDFSEDAVTASLMKSWTLRGTMHLFDKEDLPLFFPCEQGKNMHENEWTKQNFWNSRPGWALTPERQTFFCDVILDALAKKERTREELKAVCREKGMTEGEEHSFFDPWGGGIRLMCEKGFLHYRAQEEKIFALTMAFSPLTPEKAALQLTERYFAHYGPATLHDAMYFFHGTAGKMKQQMEKLPLAKTEWMGKTYFYLEDGNEIPGEMPPCLFLSGFDPLMMGHEKKESLFLPAEHMRKVFNLAGIVMPTVLLHGQIAGVWKRKGTKMTVTPFAPLSPKDKSLTEETALSLFPDLQSLHYE